MKFLDYLKARVQEKSTAAGLAALVVSAVCLIFPDYAGLIVQIAAALGVGVAVVPTSKPPSP